MVWSVKTLTSIFAGALACFALSSSCAMAQQAEPPAFRIELRSAALESKFERKRTEQEPITKSLMNSAVTGSQSTVTETRLRVLPETNPFQFELINRGSVSSETTGINRRATVQSSGQHSFEIIKPFWFDGDIFLTRTCYGSIQANENPQRVMSAAGARAPLLAPLGDRIAWQRVLRMQPQINQAVAEDVSRDVLPKIDRIIDDDFGQLGKLWAKTQGQLAAMVDQPSLVWKAGAGRTSVHIWVAERKSASQKLATPPDTLTSKEDLTIAVRDSLVARLLKTSVRGGQRISDQQLLALKQAVSALNQGDSQSLAGLSEAISINKPATVFSLELRPEAPFEVQFVDGDVRVVVHFQIHPTLGSSSGWMSTTFNLRGRRLSDSAWTVDVRSFEVNEDPGTSTDAATADSPAALQIPGETVDPPTATDDPEVTTVQAGTVWMPLVRTAIQSAVDSAEPVEIPLEVSDITNTLGDTRMRLVQVAANRGELRFSFRLVSPPSAERAPGN
ncbi:MAG: hypothetical protein U0996_12780 [Planctomycetaceae bacterium]